MGNVSGALVLGLVTGVSGSRPERASGRAVLGVGVAGGFTSSSTLMFETAALLRGGARRYGLGNLLANLLGSAVAVGIGLGLGGCREDPQVGRGAFPLYCRGSMPEPTRLGSLF